MLSAASRCLILLLLVLLPVCSLAADRGHRAQRPLIEDPLLLPSANAPSAASSNILSGVDFTCIAPPDSRIRVIEDEPYIYTAGERNKERLRTDWAHSSISIRADLGSGGSFEAVVSLLWQRRCDAIGVLRAFDTAAHEAYERSALSLESRDGSVYGIYEVRSPLGIVEPLKGCDSRREFLAYSAAVDNPLLSNPLESGTPYQYVSGKLMAVPSLALSTTLVSVEFTARDFPHSLRLSENIARCVVNRLYVDEHSRLSVDLLDYAPEYEIVLPQTDSLGRSIPVDPRTADLVEQPGEGCGPLGLPPGGLLPSCPEPSTHWPAQPYSQFTDRLSSACHEACDSMDSPQPRTVAAPAQLTGWESPDKTTASVSGILDLPALGWTDAAPGQVSLQTQGSNDGRPETEDPKAAAETSTEISDQSH